MKMKNPKRMKENENITASHMKANLKTLSIFDQSHCMSPDSLPNGARPTMALLVRGLAARGKEIESAYNANTAAIQVPREHLCKVDIVALLQAHFRAEETNELLEDGTPFNKNLVNPASQQQPVKRKNKCPISQALLCRMV